ALSVPWRTFSRSSRSDNLQPISHALAIDLALAEAFPNQLCLREQVLRPIHYKVPTRTHCVPNPRCSVFEEGKLSDHPFIGLVIPVRDSLKVPEPGCAFSVPSLQEVNVT